MAVGVARVWAEYVPGQMLKIDRISQVTHMPGCAHGRHLAAHFVLVSPKRGICRSGRSSAWFDMYPALLTRPYLSPNLLLMEPERPWQ